MSSVDPPVGEGASVPVEVRAAARDGVREVVAAGGASGSSGRRWVVPTAAVAAVAAAACAPVAWPLLAGGAAAAALAAAFGQVGAVGGGLLTEAVIRAWDRSRAGGRPGIGQSELREALAAELGEALTSSSPVAAGLRAEVAGVLQGVDAVNVALTTTIKTTARESGDQARAVLIRGLRDLGTQFTEFGWLLEEVNDQITRVAETQAEIAAGSRAMLEAQQRTLMQLTILRQQTSPVHVDSGPGGLPRISEESLDEERAAALGATGVPVGSECPYPGLAAFGPQDAGRFFGREQATAALVTRLAEQLTRPGLLMVLGPSGSGKSSLLRAGLLPAIAAGGLPVRGSQGWPQALLTPARQPLLELATRVAALAGIPAGALNADLRTDPARITAAIRQALLAHARRHAQSSGLSPRDVLVSDLDAPGHPAYSAIGVAEQAVGTGPGRVAYSPRLVLVVDQFEEVFTQCTDERERQAFIHALCAAAGATAAEAPPRGGDTSPGLLTSRDASAIVVIGIRADFYARCATYPELARYLQDCQVLVGPMDQAGLRAAIESPAASAGLVVDAGLVEVLLADLGLHPHPIIPLASAQAPAEMTVPEAGSRQASPDGGNYEAGRLPLLAYALQQTWQHRDGRRLTVASYRATGGIDGAVARAAEAVYERFDADGTQAARLLLLRLVSLGEGTADTRRRVAVTELTGTPEIEGPDTPPTATAQTVLTDLVQARLLTADTDTDGRDAVEISHEALLSAWPRLREWLSQDRAGQRIHRDLTDASHAWQAQGREPSHLFSGARLAVASEWAASHRRDLNANERAFLAASQQHERRATRWRRTAVAALAVLTLISVGAAGLAVYRNSQAVSEAVKARNEARTATALALASDAQANAERGPDIALLLSLAALAPYSAGPAAPTVARSNMIEALETTRLEGMVGILHGGIGPVDSVAFSPDGRTLASGSQDGTARMWDVATHRQLGSPLTANAFPVDSVAFSPDGRTLASGSQDGTARMWDVATHRQLGSPLTANAFPVDSVAFSPDGRTLASGSQDGMVRLWDVASHSQLGLPLTSNTAPVLSVVFSPDGRRLAVGGLSGTVRLWDVATHRQLGSPLTGNSGAVWSVAFSPDGRTLASGSQDGTARLWDVATHRQLGSPLTANAFPVDSVAFSPDGRTLASGSQDGMVRLWDVASHKQQGSTLTGDSGSVDSIAFSPDKRTLASGSYDGTVQLWDLSTAGQRGSPLTANTNSGFYTSHDVGERAVAFSPDGRRLAVGGLSGTVRLWDVATRTQLGSPLTGNTGPVRSVAFSPDGRRLAVGGLSGTVRLWDVATRTQQGSLQTGNTGPVRSIAFSPNGTLAVGFNDGEVRLWDLATHTQLGLPLTSHTAPILSVAFSPDGRRLAVGGDDGAVRLWDVATRTQLGSPLTGNTGPVRSVAFSADGRTLASSIGRMVRLWDVATQTQLGLPLTSNTASVLGLVFRPDESTLVSASYDGTVRVWSGLLWRDFTGLRNQVCSLVGTGLNRSEWTLYAPGIAYQARCP